MRLGGQKRLKRKAKRKNRKKIGTSEKQKKKMKGEKTRPIRRERKYC